MNPNNRTPGYAPKGSATGRYGVPGTGGGLGGRGGPGMGPGSSRSSAAQQAQARLRALMSNGGDDNPEEYNPPPVGGMQIPGRAPAMAPRGMGGVPGVAPGMNRTRSATGQFYEPGPEMSIPDRQDSYRSTGSGGIMESNSRGRMDMGGSKQEVESLRREAAKLRDEVDVLSEEKEYLEDNLRLKDEELRECQARNRELEKQVASMGEGISMEARLLNKKEAALKQREATLREMKDRTKDTKEVELASARMELEAQKEETAAALEEAKKLAQEVGVLKSITSRITLSPEEKEEVVMKRCWLARYWALAVKNGVHAKIAGVRSEYWQEFSPLPFEVVLDAGRKAKEEPKDGDNPAVKTSSSTTDNIESIFQVEKALRDLAALKAIWACLSVVRPVEEAMTFARLYSDTAVEEAVMLAMAQHRRPALLKVQSAPAADGPRMVESMDLSEEEVEDVRFKQNWLMYWWRRAKTYKVEPDIAAERLQYWISRSTVKPTAHDAVDAERGLMEVREINLEQQLWDASRKELSDQLTALASE